MNNKADTIRKYIWKDVEKCKPDMWVVGLSVTGSNLKLREFSFQANAIYIRFILHIMCILFMMRGTIKK